MSGFFASSIIQKERPVGQVDEVWLPVIGREGYEISSFGRVRALSRTIVCHDGRKMRLKGGLRPSLPNKKRGGYLYIQLYQNNKSLTVQTHRLVAKHFIPNPRNLPEVNHKDGDKKNCRWDNLEWVTPKENSAHYALIRTNRKVPLHLVYAVRRWAGVAPISELSKDLGINESSARAILKGKSWVSV